jgi:hypothetical protein
MSEQNIAAARVAAVAFTGWLLTFACHISSAHDADERNAAASARIGKVHFENSCDPSVAKDFDLSVALLHSFWAREAIEGFNHVLKRDASCAIAYWGIAMALQQNPLTGQEPAPQFRADALAGLEKARTIGAKTQRERDYLAAIELIYKDAGTTDFRARRGAYEKAMAALAGRYPGDDEAKVFYALALDMTADLSDRTYAHQLKAVSILEPLLQKYPEHPGIPHYLIHSYDYPPIAARGVPAARLYAQVAPENPHALHMPSHIFTRLGMWQDSIETNQRSAAAAKAEGNGQEQAHAMDYLVHAYLQLGEDRSAKRVVDEGTPIAVNPNVFIGHYALAAMPARYVVERRAWDEATQLQVRATKFAFPDAITHFARGLGFAHKADLPAAERETAALAALRDALLEQKNAYWSKQIDVQRLAVQAWAELAAKRPEQALKLMSASADLEDTMEKHIVTPGPVVPARELLGEMLLELGEPAQALTAFELSAKREPNRYRGLYGAARAAALSGDAAKAKLYYERFLALAAKADSARPEVRQAKAYVAQR